MFEGEQLEKLFDLLEELLLALPDNSSHEENIFKYSIIQQVRKWLICYINTTLFHRRAMLTS